MEQEQEQRLAFLTKVEQRLGDKSKSEDFEQGLDLDHHEMSHYEDDDDGGIDQMPDREEQQFEHFDRYLKAEVLLAKGGRAATGTVDRRK
jgi:hypothetical protein